MCTQNDVKHGHSNPVEHFGLSDGACRTTIGTYESMKIPINLARRMKRAAYDQHGSTCRQGLVVNQVVVASLFDRSES
jgi:hypothetical protein